MLKPGEIHITIDGNAMAANVSLQLNTYIERSQPSHLYNHIHSWKNLKYPRQQSYGYRLPIRLCFQ